MDACSRRASSKREKSRAVCFAERVFSDSALKTVALYPAPSRTPAPSSTRSGVPLMAACGGTCSAEFVAYLGCLDMNEGKEEACRAPREALSRCMFAAAASARGQNRHKPPINYHLQKFIKGFKR